MTQNKQNEEIGILTERLLKKSLDAGRVYWEETAGRIAGIVSGQDSLREWQRFSTDFWSNAYTDLAKMYFRYAENVLDYGINLAHQLHQEKNGAVSPASPAMTQPAVFHLSGEAGSTASRAFALHSSEPQVQAGSFRYTSFFAEDSGVEVPVELSITPAFFEIQPDHSSSFSIQAFIPEAIPLGRYRSQVVVEGFADSRFDILLEVLEKTAA